MESIQLAQMLADLSDLNAAQESQAASALVNANKTLPTPSQSAPPGDSNRPPEKMPSRPGLRNHARTGSAGSTASAGSSFMSRTASPAKFDKYGRRLVTPPNTRTNSAYSSMPGTPRDSEMDDDIERANTLMALYDIRAKLKDQDSSRNLSKLREKVAALHAKQVQAEKKEHDGSNLKFSYPKST